jgi:beta-phosphoglucomutase-like phosphatase (HAD superfamily)
MSLDKVKEQIQNSQALIFDCDGTLLDTKAVYIRAWTAGFKANEQTFDVHWFEENAGLSEHELLAEFEKSHHVELDKDQVLHTMHTTFLEGIDEISEISVVCDMVRASAGSKPMAVASGGPLELVTACLKAKNLFKFFDIVVTKDHVKHGKPEPDIFLEAANQLQIDPKHCLVFDDRPEGLKSAHKAGIPAVDIKTFI